MLNNKPGEGIFSNVKEHLNTHQVKEVELNVKSEEAYREMEVQYDAVLSPTTSWKNY